MGIEQIIYYCLACFVVVIVPGPTVTLIIVNSISFGTRAGLLNVAGTQLGLILMIGLLAIGFQVVAQQLEWFLIAIRFLGAIYLVWLGYNIFTSPSLIVNYYRYGPKANDEKYPNNKFVLQGLLVIWSNPKAFLFLGAFIPQFFDINQLIGFQIIYLGFLFMLIGVIFDSAYAVVFGKFRNLISSNYLKLLNRIGGGIIVSLGIWLALN